MRKFVLPGAAIAALAFVSVGAYQYFTTQSVPEITFRSQVAMPKLLLPDAKTHECRRERVEDGRGGAVDQVDMDNGYTKEVHFKVLPYVQREDTYYPALPAITSCEAFAAVSGDGPRRGPIFKESLRSVDGKRPVSELQWSPTHKLIAESKLLADPNKFETVHYSDAGIVNGSDVFDLLRKRKESESYYRDNGTKKQTKFITMVDDYFADYFFAEDGVTLLWKDDRSFGSYTIEEYYPGGVTPKLEAKRMPYNTNFTEYRPDGSKARLIRVMDNFFIDVVLYDNEGKAYELRRFKTKRVGNKDVLDNAGKPVKVISSISVVDEKENPSRVYTFDDGGALKTVTEVPHHKFWADHTDYTLDSSGTAVSKKVWNEKGEFVGEFTLPDSNRPRFALSQDRLTVPTWRTPELLGQYDAKVNLEQPREH